MSGFKHISLAADLDTLLLVLRGHFPMSQSMWQVVRDTRDGVMEAEFFTDDWPNFTTVISREFAPRLSEVSDLRIYTMNKERVMQVIDGARLLENVGNTQNILYLTEENDELSQYLLDKIAKHPVSRNKAVSWYSIPVSFIEEFPEDASDQHYFAPPGYVIKHLSPEDAELVASHWDFKDWFTEVIPHELKRGFIEQVIRRFIGIGVYTTDNPLQPVAWTFRKSGGIHGISFTSQEHRSNGVFLAACTEVITRAATRCSPVVILSESFSPKNASGLFKVLGLSHSIVIHSPVIHSSL